MGTESSDFFRKNICFPSVMKWPSVYRNCINQSKIWDRNSQDRNLEARNCYFRFGKKGTEGVRSTLARREVGRDERDGESRERSEVRDRRSEVN